MQYFGRVTVVLAPNHMLSPVVMIDTAKIHMYSGQG